MSFGLEIFNTKNQPQLSTSTPIYKCIYSGVHSDDFWIMRSKKVGDIVALTYLSGAVNGKSGGVGFNHGANWWNPASPLRLYGSHRVCVFRATTFSVPHTGYGLEILNESGGVSFSSELYPLILIDSPAQSPYPALVFSGVSTDYRITSQWDNNYNWEERHVCRFVRVGGTALQTVVHTVYSYSSSTHPEKMEVNVAPVYVDVSKIPLNYNLGIL